MFLSHYLEQIVFFIFKATTSQTTTSNSIVETQFFILFLIATTTVNPCGTPVSVGTSSSLYSASSGSSSYTCFYFAWTASTTGSVTLSFQFQNNPSSWYMDDVSVSNGTTELLINGGFETSSFSPGWTVSTPNGACVGSTIGAQVVSSPCRTGSYCLSDGCGFRSDQVAQSFTVTAGQVYLISFWLELGGGGSGVSVSVTLS